MSKLQRVRSTDLQVLRSMLSQENESSFNEFSNSDFEQEQINSVEYKSNCEATNSTDIKKTVKIDKYLQPVINKNEKPFLITRIESKNVFSRIDRSKSESNSVNKLRNSKDFKLPMYESIHHKSIITTENRLEKKYEELGKLLNRDVLMRTVSLCDQSINDARQLIQNSLAASRIVSGFIQDISKSNKSSDSNNCAVNEDIFISTEQLLNQDIKSPLFDRRIESSTERSTGNIYNPSIQNQSTNLFGLSSSFERNPSSIDNTRRTATDHILNSDEPFIQQWLNRKNQEMRLEKQLKREEDKIEKAISVSAEAVKEQRRVAAEEAFKRWLSTKKPFKKQLYTSSGDDSSDSSTEYLPQAGRQPKPLKTARIRRFVSVPRPKSSATFQMCTNAKMKVLGHQMPLLVDHSMQKTNQVQICYPKPVFKTDAPFKRPETAFPQSRSKSSRCYESRFTARELKSSRNKLKKKKSFSKTHIEEYDNGIGGQILSEQDKFRKNNNEIALECDECGNTIENSYQMDDQTQPEQEEFKQKDNEMIDLEESLNILPTALNSELMANFTNINNSEDLVENDLHELDIKSNECENISEEISVVSYEWSDDTS